MSVVILRPASDYFPAQWTPQPAGAHYSTIDDAVTQPTVPTITDYLYTSNHDYKDSLMLQAMPSFYRITGIKIWGYGKITQIGIDQIHATYTKYYAPQTYKNFGFTGSNSWKSVEWTGLNITPVEVMGLQAVIKSVTGAPPTCFLYCLYVEVTYTTTQYDAALPAYKRAMSGYNYFVQNYVRRRLAGKLPYKLPSGELYNE